MPYDDDGEFEFEIERDEDGKYPQRQEALKEICETLEDNGAIGVAVFAFFPDGDNISVTVGTSANREEMGTHMVLVSVQEILQHKLAEANKRNH